MALGIKEVMVIDVSSDFFFFQAEDGIRDHCVTGVQTCALPISGNIRELENVVERGVILARGEVLMPGDLPPELTKSAPAPTGSRTLPLKRALEIPEIGRASCRERV